MSGIFLTTFDKIPAHMINSTATVLDTVLNGRESGFRRIFAAGWNNGYAAKLSGATGHV